MTENITLKKLTLDNMYELPCCGIKNTKHKGYIAKTEWIKDHLKKGWTSYILYVEENQQIGHIEYIPGKYAWRGIEADNYMFILCVWTHYKKYQRKGYGQHMIQACLDDAKKAKMDGVAVIARERPWLAKKELFLKSGFEIVDTCPPDYNLMVKKFNPSAPNPKFKNNWENKLKKFGKGLTIIRSNQCPHIIKFADDIAEMAENTYKLKPNIVELKSYHDAQNAPTPYAVFSIIYNGQLLTDHQISKTRFKNIMQKIL